MTSRSSGIWPVLAAVVIVSASVAAAAEDWPHWRGARRNGAVAERSGWPNGWPPKKLWDRNVGRGCASPVIVAGKLYVMGWRGSRSRGGRGTDTLYCFDAATGRELWKQSYPCPYQGRVRTGDTTAYGGPSSTPSFDVSTGRIYTISIDGDLRCWDTRKNGKLVWRVNLYDAYKAPQRPNVGGGRRDYGYPTSALIRGETLLVEVGSRQGTVMAFDKRTGRRIWASQYNGPAGHTGGLTPMTVGGAECIAVLTLQNLVVMRVDKGHEGRTVATTKWQTEFACNIATPVAVGNRVLVTSAYNNKAACLFEVSPGRLRAVWRSRYYSTAGSPVIHRGRVYVIKNAIHCLDLATGRLRWRGGSFGDGSSLATADDKIIAFGNGRIRLLEASPQTTEYRELVRLDRLFRGTCYPHVTLSGGILCAKDRDGHMICFDTKQRATGAAVAKPPPPRKPPAVVKMPKMADTWPGNADALVFVWATGKSTGNTTVKPRGRVSTGDGGEMVLGEGAMVAQGVDAALLAACKASNQLSVEAVLTPRDIKQGGPARIISFSQDGYNRNFTIAQERGTLLLRLRTTRTGENGMRPQTELCRLTAGRPHHVIVTYSPGRLTCYLNGKRVLQTDRVGGDFSNWSPMHLLFGDEWKDARRWAGRLQGIAIHARVIGAEEAAVRHKLATGGAAGSP